LWAVAPTIVVDFGIAYVDGIEGTRLTQHGALLGTPA
jgi:hypothetical protein